MDQKQNDDLAYRFNGEENKEVLHQKKSWTMNQNDASTEKQTTDLITKETAKDYTLSADILRFFYKFMLEHVFALMLVLTNLVSSSIFVWVSKDNNYKVDFALLLAAYLVITASLRAIMLFKRLGKKSIKASIWASAAVPVMISSSCLWFIGFILSIMVNNVFDSFTFLFVSAAVCFAIISMILYFAVLSRLENS